MPSWVSVRTVARCAVGPLRNLISPTRDAVEGGCRRFLGAVGHRHTSTLGPSPALCLLDDIMDGYWVCGMIVPGSGEVKYQQRRRSMRLQRCSARWRHDAQHDKLFTCLTRAGSHPITLASPTCKLGSLRQG
ncbi:hypothetical protein B0T16DRAFT_403376 [Cercophora newfieldiana]|uniref:Uncharacterized protein n=1 Tax=Cercophora newfieldiana TaxID=92897 RepID=A0AA39YEL5_9PEZI|nr:hypothetical protein B0T16DRAFT_403376 [Cercophora newfieldiana]